MMKSFRFSIVCKHSETVGITFYLSDLQNEKMKLFGAFLTWKHFIP